MDEALALVFTRFSDPTMGTTHHVGVTRRQPKHFDLYLWLSRFLSVGQPFRLFSIVLAFKILFAPLRY